MTIETDSQFYDAYIPVYDAIPESWEEGRQFLVKRLKEHANAINIREIGWLLDEELLNGQQFFPGVNSSNDQVFRSVFRKVIDFGPRAPGVYSVPHGVTVDANFSLIELYGAASNATTLTGTPINQPNITYDAVNINITLTGTFDRVFAFFTYMQEV
ncbi:MAG: hypothetical protein ACHP6H_06720 [Legionellales bacterium]